MQSPTEREEQQKKRKGGASLRGKKWDWKEMRKNEWKTSSRRGAEVYLEFEIEVTAGTLSNPVCLHGFHPVPLWQVCQGIQQRLQEGHRKEDTRKKFSLKSRKSFLPPSLWNFLIYIFFKVGNCFLIIRRLSSLQHNVIDSSLVCPY